LIRLNKFLCDQRSGVLRVEMASGRAEPGRTEKGLLIYFYQAHTRRSIRFPVLIAARKEGKIMIPSPRDVTMENFRTLRPGHDQLERREKNFHFSGPFASAVEAPHSAMMKLI
jgi:hypothetical protein